MHNARYEAILFLLTYVSERSNGKIASQASAHLKAVTEEHLFLNSANAEKGKRLRTCNCGTCRKCKARENSKKWYDRNYKATGVSRRREQREGAKVTDEELDRRAERIID